MKIDGIDPLLLNKIKEQQALKEVQPAEKSAAETRVTREGRSGQERDKTLSGNAYEQKVRETIDRLNRDAKNEGQPLRFSVHKESKLWHIEVYDIENNKKIREIPTEKALEVANRMQSLFGILMDEKR